MTNSLQAVNDAREAINAARASFEAAIVQARAAGETVPAIAQAAGLTRQRVYQIVAEAEQAETGMRERLALLDKRWEDFVESMMGRPGDYKRVTALQNGMNRKLAARGAAWKPVSVVMRDHVESQALAVLEHRDDDPRVQVVRAYLDEAATLRKRLTALQDSRAFGDVDV